MQSLTRSAEQLSVIPDPAHEPTAVVVAHPDDEVIGIGSMLRHFAEAIFVHVTDGSPRDLRDAQSNGFATREAYALQRRSEFMDALTRAGISRPRHIQLRIVDKEASLNLVSLTQELLSIFAKTNVACVLTHAYEGGHPDHDSTAFAVHAACALSKDSPQIVEMAGYHQGPSGILTGEFLPPRGAVETVVLDSDGRRHKQELLECFPTQRETLRYFGCDSERFRPAPAYDFTQAPHQGALFYEHYDWGMTGPEFRKLAKKALDELGLEGAI